MPGKGSKHTNRGIFVPHEAAEQPRHLGAVTRDGLHAQRTKLWRVGREADVFAHDLRVGSGNATSRRLAAETERGEQKHPERERASHGRNSSRTVVLAAARSRAAAITASLAACMAATLTSLSPLSAPNKSTSEAPPLS